MNWRESHRGALLAVATMLACGLLARGLMPASDLNEVNEGDLQGLARQLEGKLVQTQAVVHARATTIAEIRQLGVIVYTDADTARDLTRHELSFEPLARETIEVHQWFRGKPPFLLLRIPADAAPIVAPDVPGIYVRPGTHGITLSEVTQVRTRTRSEESDKLGGTLLISHDIDLAPLAPRLENLRAAVWLESGEQLIPLTRNPRVSGAKEMRLPLGEVGQSNVALVAQGRPGVGRLPWLLGALLSGFAVVFFARRLPTAGLSMQETATPSMLQSVLPPSVVSVSPSSQLSGGRTRAHTISSLKPEPGARRIGRYAVVKRLGSGGMAEVFLARAEGPSGFEKMVALKVLKPELAEERAIVDHLIAEARLASSLDHPNVVEIIELGVDQDCFIAMEFVDGADLRRLFSITRQRRKPIPLPIVFSLLRSICDGLHAAHGAIASDGAQLRLIHRDVKLANVLVGRNGVIKVSDFGIAQADPTFRGFATQNGEVKGTMAYMAPEQRLGGAIDQRVDVYGVGIIAYQLLSGARLNLDVMRLRALAKAGWPHLPPLAELRPDVPKEVEEVVLKAMAYMPEDRYQSCEEFDYALGELVGRYDLVVNRRTIARWVQDLLTGDTPRVPETDPVLPVVPSELPPAKDSTVES